MFKRIINFFRDIRIKLDFPQYEKKCRIEHERLAENSFSTKKIEDEIHILLSKINLEADNIFKENITEKQITVARVKSNITGLERNLSYFTRDYKQELADLYEKKKQFFVKKEEAHNKQKEIKSELADAFEEKDSAYESLNSYKDCIDSWYAKSERTGWLLGNKGKKLPKHSLFGQSFGDLDSYKYDRDAAHDVVVDCKEKIGDLKREQKKNYDSIANFKQDIGNLINKINKTKEDRTYMYALKKEGHSKNGLQAELSENSDILRLEQANLSELESERKKFVEAEKIKNGVVDLESNVNHLKAEKIQKLKEFDLENNHETRIKEHRLLWLKERNMA